MPRPPKKPEVDVSKLRDIEEYTHDDKQRTNNPPVGMAQHDKSVETVKTYQFDPHLDPTLQWAGKAEGMSFDVPTSSIHIHESIKPHRILGAVQAIGENDEAFHGAVQMSMFEDPLSRMRRRQAAIQFYQHGVDWTNRMIAGDSLVIMNSLLEKEGMAGQVQMVYIDPPYGIKYGSNFQPFVNDTSFKSSDRDEDLTQEPEMITAFRDTWELGIHSYLTYLRSRLKLVKNLLNESGSVFVQISDENLHYVRCLCDEIFGSENFVSQISVKKGSVVFAKKLLNSATFYIVWYANNKEKIKYRNLYTNKGNQWFADSAGAHLWSENPSTGETIRPTPEERTDIDTFLARHPGFELYRLLGVNAQGNEKTEGYEFKGKTYYPPRGTQWKTSYPEGLDRLAEAGRLQAEDTALGYKMYYRDYPIITLNRCKCAAQGSSTGSDA